MLTAVAASTLSGCGAGPGQRATALPAIQPAASTGLARSTPPRPPVAAGDRLAVERVVRRYYRIVDHLREDMDAAGLAAIMTPSCGCRALPRAVRRAIARRQRFFGTAHLLDLAPSIDGPRLADVLVAFNATRGGLVDQAGQVVASAPGVRQQRRDFVLIRQAGTWLIDRIVRLG